MAMLVMNKFKFSDFSAEDIAYSIPTSNDPQAIVTKVAGSGPGVLEWDSFPPEDTPTVINIAPHLWEGIALKESIRPINPIFQKYLDCANLVA